MIDYLKKKAQEYALVLASLLVGLQILAGTFSDIVLGALVVGIVYLQGKVK